jgi:outer membrane lipoprotein LolB
VIRRLLLVSALVLGGCTTPEIRPVPADIQSAWQQRQVAMHALHAWELHARIAMQYGNDGGQASLFWIRADHQNDIRLVGPWGKGLVRLNFNSHFAQLTDDTGQTTEGDDAATLLYEATGWVIPVSKLDTWVTGMPVSQDAKIQLDKYGRLQSLVEAGWKIEYREYRQFGNQELPRRMVLSQQHVDGNGKTVSVKLVISQWQVSA